MSIPVNYQETLAQQVRWAARNMSYNLGFIPEDKLDWKPAPAAPSALEIANHIMGAMLLAQSVLRGGEWNEWNEAEFTPASTLQEIQAQLVPIADEFAATVEAVRADQMDRMLDTPFGTIPLSVFIRFEPIDIVHHHGQITFIQQLLGDEESHFDPSAS